MGKSFRRERTDWGQRGREQRRERQQQPRQHSKAIDEQEWDDMEPLFPWGVDQPQQQPEQEHA